MLRNKILSARQDNNTIYNNSNITNITNKTKPKKKLNNNSKNKSYTNISNLSNNKSKSVGVEIDFFSPKTIDYQDYKNGTKIIIII